MPEERSVSAGGDQRWAHFRFSVIGPLLAAPPGRGRLRSELQQLAEKKWRHPISGEWVRYGASTIERWYYQALGEPKDPVGALVRKIREDQGSYPSLSAELRDEIHLQYRQHPNWSYQLHYDNLAVRVKEDPRRLGCLPGYQTVRRYMKAHGLYKRRRLGGRRRTAGAEAAERRFESHEIRSHESEYVNALWHFDGHHGSLPVLTSPGQWVYPVLVGILDDHSRLCCHAQWYLAETAENVVHGLSQAFQKRGLPRGTMSDNGGAMTAAETDQGLVRLAIAHETTLPYSPWANGKQESFWGLIEGRVLPMLEDCKDLTLAQLNEATLAWIEMEYNRRIHSETGQPPLVRFLHGKDIGRPCPSSELLRQAFTAQYARKQRRSDGTISVEGVRFEVPSRYRHFQRVTIRYAAWDLSHVYMAEERSGKILTRLYPLDRQRNADGRRRRKEPLVECPEISAAPSGQMAPLMRQLIAEYAATGLPPAYLPKDELHSQRKECTDE